MTQSSPSVEAFDPRQIKRPDSSLLGYYVALALITGPFSPLTFLPLFFRYQTLRYRFDEQGISMKWGLLFHREIYLTYRRIQDIHLTSNILQRWFGLATVAIQTASGSASPEMSIEGIAQYAQLRDYLYTRMRGARGLDDGPVGGDAGQATAQQQDESLQLLREIRDLLQRHAGQREASS